MAMPLPSDQARAQDLSGVVKAMGNDPMAAICAANVCRTDISITLRKDDGSDYVFSQKHGVPKVYNQMATALPG